MCNASIHAINTRDAAIGDTVCLLTDDHGQPYFHSAGDDPDLLTCIKHGSVVIVSGVSLQAARQLGIDGEFQGVFAQDHSEQADAIWLGDSKFVSLYELVSAGASLRITYASLASETELEEFQRRYDVHFSGRRSVLATHWGYPPEVPSDAHRLVVDELPVAIDVDGRTIDLWSTTAQPIDESAMEGIRTSELQPERKLERV